MAKGHRAWMLIVAMQCVACVFTSRPQLPTDDDVPAAADAPAMPPGDDATVSFDVAPPPADVVTPDVLLPSDATAPFADAGASDAAPAPHDASADAGESRDDCRYRPGGTAGLDAGFYNDRGEPCDPAASPDAGAADAPAFDVPAIDGGDAGDAGDVPDARDAGDVTDGGDVMDGGDAGDAGDAADGSDANDAAGDVADAGADAAGGAG